MRSIRYRAPKLAFGAPFVGPALADATLRMMRLRRATPAGAMIDDYEACRRPWGFDPAAVRGEVSLWHGLADRLVPAAHGQRLAEALPDCATFLEPGAGHFFFGARVAEIIAPLVHQIDEGTTATAPDLRLAA